MKILRFVLLPFFPLYVFGHYCIMKEYGIPMEYTLNVCWYRWWNEEF